MLDHTFWKRFSLRISSSCATICKVFLNETKRKTLLYYFWSYFWRNKIILTSILNFVWSCLMRWIIMITHHQIMLSFEFGWFELWILHKIRELRSWTLVSRNLIRDRHDLWWSIDCLLDRISMDTCIMSLVKRDFMLRHWCLMLTLHSCMPFLLQTALCHFLF